MQRVGSLSQGVQGESAVKSFVGDMGRAPEKSKWGSNFKGKLITEPQTVPGPSPP